MTSNKLEHGWTEAERLATLARYEILDTPPEQVFDDLVLMVAETLDMPIVAVNLIAEGRQWFKAEIGLGTREVPLEDSICRFAMLNGTALEVPDTFKDSRFAHNPLVTGAPGLRFYAGELLITPEGYPLGTLCVLDVKPRPEGLTSRQRFVLKTIAQQIMNQLELRRIAREQDALLEAQRRVESALRAERDYSRRLLEGMDEGYIFLDRTFRVREINAGGLRFETRPASDILGRLHWEVWPGSEDSPIGTAYKRAMTERTTVSLEQRYVYEDGRSLWLDVRAYPANDGLAVFYRDITDRKQDEEQLRETAARLQFTLESANIGEWDLDLLTDVASRSLRHDQCFGYSTPIPDWGFEKFISHVHPEDREFVAEQFHRSLSELKDWHFECRVVWPDNTVHWIAAHGSIYHVDTKPTRMSGIVFDITQRKQADEELRKADRRKDEFLAMLAHELRNPLAPIAAAADLLSLARLDESHIRKTSAIISRQVCHMRSLVDDLLDVSRVTRGLISLERITLDVKDIIADAIEQVRPLIEARSHRLAVELAPVSACVTGDKARLVQVLTNLLNNAAKYTPEGGSLAISMEVRDREVALEVRDNGIGMAPELVARAFDLFAQAERSPDRAQGGLGIGLALVKSLVELHGGTVSVNSAGIGRGSRFSISLPRLVERLPKNPVRDPSPVHAASVGLRLVVVDDNVDAAYMLAMFLEATGHEVFVEHQSDKALECVRTVIPDVCLLDIGLPDMDGNELARRLRGLPETTRTVLIAVTGYGQEQDRMKALAAGFDYHLVKPVDTGQLSALMANIAQLRRQSWQPDS